VQENTITFDKAFFNGFNEIQIVHHIQGVEIQSMTECRAFGE
jgi:hypothetical protein